MKAIAGVKCCALVDKDSSCLQKQALAHILISFIITLSVFFSNNAIASPENALTASGNAYINDITKMIGQKNPNIKKIKDDVKKLEDLQGEAKDCVSKSLEQIKSIDEILGETGVVIPDHATSEGQQYLTDKRKYYIEDLTECRFLVFRIKESLPDFKAKVQEFSQSKILLKSLSIFDVIPNIKYPSEYFQVMAEEYEKTGISVGFGFILVGITIFMLIGYAVRRTAQLHEVSFFRLRAMIFYALFIPGMYIYNMATFDYNDDPSYTFYRMIYVAAIVLSFIFLLWPLFKLFISKNKLINGMICFIRWSVLILLSLLVVILFLGYYDLFLYISESLILTIILLALYLSFLKIISLSMIRFSNLKYPSAVKVHYHFGIRMNRHIHELSIIQYCVVLILTYLSIFYLMSIWSIPVLLIDQFSELINSGITVSNITIVPARIVYGLLVFSVISLFGRALSAYFSHQLTLSTEKDSQVAIASIVGYLCFALAVLVSFLVAGVNFTGLAIIAGALSVGIGFGLQHIVNNFICGVILLIQKPIKPGDRVIVGEAEGFVRRIRILSTQINTVSREDIIVPNSDLITHPITNFMFRDSFWRVTCSVGVKYGSDVELVKKLLLKVAMDNPDVIKEEPNAPVVLFKTFGDSALQFELWCIIKNVNKKNIVNSDLNSAIDVIFNENNICMAYPQRDIHILEPVKLIKD